MGRRSIVDRTDIAGQPSLLWSILSNPRAVIEKYHTIGDSTDEDDDAVLSGVSTIDAELHAGLILLEKNGERIDSLQKKWSREILPIRLSRSTFAGLSEKRHIVLQHLLQCSSPITTTTPAPIDQKSHSICPPAMENSSQLRPSSWSKVAGSDPVTWPDQLNAFLESIVPLEILHLRNEPDEVAEKFFLQAIQLFRSSSHDVPLMMRILVACIAFMTLHGSLYCLIEVLKLLVEIEQNHRGWTLPPMPSCVKALQSLQSEFDLPLPWTKAVLGVWSEAATGSKRDNVKGKGLASDGTYLYIHNGYALHKIGSGFNGSVRGQLYAIHKGYRSRESVSLAYANSTLIAISSQCEWPFADIIDTSDLNVSGFLQLGTFPDADVPEKKSDHNPLIISDGTFVYLFDIEQLLTPRSDASSDEKASKCERLVLYVYTIQEKTASALQDPATSNHFDPKNLACALWKSTGYRYSLPQCAIALKSSKNDPNAAAKWLLSHGVALGSPKVASFARRITLKSSEALSLSLLSRSLVYTTGVHLVVGIPPYTADHNDSADWAAKVFSMSTGDLVAQRTGLMSAIGPIGCFDSFNDVIWNCNFPLSIQFQFYRNHGPRFHPPSSDSSVSKLALESVIAEVSSIERFRSLDLSVYLLAHALRLLKQRAIVDQDTACSLSSQIQLIEKDLKIQFESGSENSKAKKRLRRKLNRARKQCIALRMSSIAPSSSSFPFSFSLSDHIFSDLLFLSQAFADLLSRSPADKTHKYAFILISTLQLFRAHFDEIESLLPVAEFQAFEGLSQTSEFIRSLLTADLPKPFDKEVKREAARALTSGFRLLFPSRQLQKEFILQTLKSFSDYAPDDVSRFVKLMLDWMANNIVVFEFLWTDICKDDQSRSIVELLFWLCLENSNQQVSGCATDVIIAIVQQLICRASQLSEVNSTSSDNVFYEYLFTFAQLFFDRLCVYLEAHSKSGSLFPLNTESPRSILVTLRSILPCISIVVNSVSVPASFCMGVLKSTSKLALAFDKINRKSAALLTENDKYMEKVSSEIPSKVSVETSHPYSVGSNVVRETVFFRNCDALCITFDPRCCTKDHLDQLTLYTDVNMNHRAPIGPFSGNEQDKNSNWPTHPIIVYGSTLALCFSAKSQPRPDDRNRWGFKCTIRGLSFHSLSDVLDIESELCATAGLLLSHLIRGPPISQDEAAVDSCLRRSLICHGLEKYDTEKEDATTMEPVRSSCGIVQLGSPADALMQSIIDGVMSPILCELQKHEYRFIGSHIIKRQPPAVQAEWHRSVRSVMACMVKHSGLNPEIMRFIRNGGRSENTMDNSFVTLQDKLGIISISAQKLQDWMLQQVQAGKRWNHLCASPTLTLSSLDEEFGNPEHFSTLIAICQFAGVEHSFLEKSDLQTILKALMQSHSEVQSAAIKLVDPYLQISSHVLQTCQQLLSFKGAFDSDTPDSGIEVPDMWRSRSVASNLNDMAQSPILRTHSVPAIKPRESVVDQTDKLTQKGFETRVHNFRNVVQTYQHWKAWQKIVTPSRSAPQEQVMPFEAVSDIIKKRFPAKLLRDVAHIQEKRIIYRIAALRLISDFLNKLTFSSAKVSVIGRLPDSLKSSDRPASLNFGVSCCHPALSSELLYAYELYFKSVSSVLAPTEKMGFVQLLAVKDLFDFEFGIDHCSLIEKCSTLQIACDLLLYLCDNIELRSQQRVLFQSLWSGFRLIAFRILKLGATDVPGRVLLPDVFIDLKKLQRIVFQLIFRLLQYFCASSATARNLIHVNRCLEKILSFLVVCSDYSSFSLFNRTEYLQTFSTVIQNPCRFSIRVTRLAVRLSQVIFPMISPAAAAQYFSSSFPVVLVNTISDLIINSNFDAECNPSDFCVVVHRSEDIDQARWIEILSNDFPELVLGRPPANDPSTRLADEMHNEVATAEFKTRSKHRSGPNIVPLKEIGGGSIQFLSDNAIVCKDGFATVIGDVSVSAGKWYFEMHLQSAGVMQIGWSTLDIMASSSAGNGIGDDKKSWAYDGRRLSKWHGEQSRYSSKRWQIGDVVGVAIDLDEKIMRYFLNGEDLGIAFSGFDLSGSPNQAVRPSCSFASGERARFVFNIAQFRCSMPTNHYPLQGDKPMPKNNPIGRAHAIMCDLTQLGLTAIWKDSSQGCYEMAAKLASKGITVTVLNQDAFAAMPPADPPDHAAADTNQKFIFSGHQASAAASEYISLGRFLLSSSLSSKSWAEAMSLIVSSILDGFCAQTLPDQSHMRQVLGAVCILGGFSEPLRVGGLADAVESGSVQHQSVILDYSPGNSFAQITMSKQSALKELRISESADAAPETNPTSQLLHRVRIDRLKSRPLFELDLGNEFPLSKPNVSCLIALMTQPEDGDSLKGLDKWLSLELRVRACLVLEALLRSSSKADSAAVKLATKHFAHLARVSHWRNFEFDRVRNVYEHARDRVWDLSSQCLGWFALPTVKHETKTSAFEQLTLSPTVSLSDLQRRQFVYGSSAYVQEVTGNPSEDTSIQRMVRFWELKIIPVIQDYVRGSFRDYEMVYFFEQLRQPLRAGDAVSAMKIVYTLCNNRVPDSVQFPALDRDWSELMCEDIMIGQALVVDPSIRSYPAFWNESLMQHIIGSVGVVQAIRFDKDLVLLQLFFEDRSVLESFWFPVSCLREPVRLDSSCSTENVDNIRRYDDAIDFLQSAVAPLPVLVARRSIISLCSQSPSFVREQLAKSADLGSLLFASLSQCLQTTLSNAGTPFHEHAGTIAEFEQCLMEAIADVPKEVGSRILEISERSISKAAEFSLSNTVVCEKAISREFFVTGTSSFLVQFSLDASLPANASFSIYADSECTRLIKCYSGGKSGLSNLQHCLISGDRFWTRIMLPADGAPITSFSFRAIALSPDFALSFWIVRFLTQQDLHCLGKNRIEIVFQFVERMFIQFGLVTMDPSPMKETILGLIYDLIQSLPAQLDSLEGAVADQVRVSLNYIAQLQPELIRLFASESLTGTFTSYLQLLLDLQITADCLRSPNDRIAGEFTAAVADQPDNHDAVETPAPPPSDDWACPLCTLLNSNSVFVCQACDGPRPSPEQLQKSSTTTSDLSPNSRDRIMSRATSLFNRVYDMVHIMQWLRSRSKPQIATPVRNMVEAAWNRARSECVEPQLFIIGGLPVTVNDADARSRLLSLITDLSGTSDTPFLVQPDSVYIGTNFDIPASSVPSMADAASFLSSQPKTLLFVPDYAMDQNGLIWYLGTKGQSESFTNPMMTGLVTVRASSLQHDSVGPEAVVGRVVVRCVSTSSERQWFEIDFHQTRICPTHYTKKDSELTEPFPRALDDLLPLPLALTNLFPAPNSDLVRFIASEISDTVINKELLRSVLRRAVQSDGLVVQIWDWLKSLGYNLDIALIVENSFEKALEESSLWSMLPDSAHEELMDHFYNLADRIALPDILQLPLNRAICSISELLGQRTLLPVSEAAIRLQFSVLQELNDSINDLLPLSVLRFCAGNRLGGLLRQCRSFIFRNVKPDLFMQISDLLAEPGRRPPILSFYRLDLASRDQECLDFIHDTFFGNAYLQLRDLAPSDLRPPQPHGTDSFLAFEVVFHGEDVVGEGGPYRQFFSDISNELLAADSPLFIPCPNQQGGIGENQDTFVIRSSASSSSSTVSLFEFFVQILGICLRTGVRIISRLPAFTWKPIVADQTSPSDLSTIDHQTSMVLQLVQTIDEELFSDMIEETFSTPLSDRTVALLRPNGDKQRVTFAERNEYVRLVHNARFNEARAQIEAIRRGINKIIPVQLLNIFLHNELELLVNGKQIIDIGLLRRHKKYSGVSADAPHIRYFWEVLNEFSQQDRRKFIRFAWVQEKLPVDDAEFVRTHTRLLIKTTPSNISPDSRFPRADTCFFNLKLPAYSSKEILHKRLLFAITHTDSTNADVIPEDQQVPRRGPDFSNLMP